MTGWLRVATEREKDNRLNLPRRAIATSVWRRRKKLTSTPGKNRQSRLKRRMKQCSDNRDRRVAFCALFHSASQYITARLYVECLSKKKTWNILYTFPFTMHNYIRKQIQFSYPNSAKRVSPQEFRRASKNLSLKNKNTTKIIAEEFGRNSRVYCSTCCHARTSSFSDFAAIPEKNICSSVQWFHSAIFFCQTFRGATKNSCNFLVQK